MWNKTMLKITLLFLISFTVLPVSAKASVYVWKDKNYGVTYAFPDTWRMQTVNQPSQLIRISAPDDNDMATCALAAVPDGRLDVYPKDLMTKAVEIKLNKEFWKAEVSRYNEGKIVNFISPSIMGGSGDATAIDFIYLKQGAKKTDKKIPMYGAMIGSIYGGNRYLAECSAKFDVYKKYSDLFYRIIESVQLDEKYTPFATGYYRNFLADSKAVIANDKPGERIPEKVSMLDKVIFFFKDWWQY